VALLAVVPWLVAWPARGAEAPVALSAAAYRAELERLIGESQRLRESPAEVPRLVAGVPTAWRVRAGARTFDVPADWLRRDLRAIQVKPTPAAADRIRGHLERLRDEFDAFQAPSRDLSAERRRAAAILARPEFAGVQGPTWFDRLRQRALSFVVDLIGRLLGSSNIPVIGRVVVYVLVGLAVLVAAIWIYRTIRTPGRPTTVLPDRLPISAKAWSAWLAEARAAAAGGDWRDGVRLAYWAAISFLESNRLWPPDRARTPREYLRLLPAGHEHRPTLSSLTRTFELAWYGNRRADEETFARAVADLEKLGCQSG
jgi:hypothetical protein